MSQLDRLTATVFDLREVVAATTDTDAILAARDRFYAALFEGAGSTVLQQLVETVRARVRVLCASSLSEEGRPQAAAKELRAVVVSIRNRDAAGAVVLMREHIQHAAAATLHTLPRDVSEAPSMITASRSSSRATPLRTGIDSPGSW